MEFGATSVGFGISRNNKRTVFGISYKRTFSERFNFKLIAIGGAVPMATIYILPWMKIELNEDYIRALERKSAGL